MWNVVLMLYILLATNVHGLEEVTTKQGKVRGRIWTSQSGRKFVGFTGIPYAKPPIGKFRFQTPRPDDPWKGTLDATKSHNPCPQAKGFVEDFTPLGNEDCLYLNVYKPQTGNNHPVMFYIHGGGFTIGSGADNWLGPEILLEGDVVLVIVNYRLGALGFLSMEDVEQPGNNGLKDQALALRWVKDNIKYFGGDDSNITVFGNSAGGMSAHLFTMSPLTKDLIARVMVQSGSGTLIKPFGGEKHKLNAEKFGRLFNCSTSSTRSLINCLQEVDVADILRTEFSFADFQGRPFQTVIEVQHDGAFLADEPVNIVLSKKFTNIPIILGMTDQEGGSRAADIYAEPTLLEKVNSDFHTIVLEGFPISDEEVLETSTAIRQFYFGNKTIDNSTKKELATLFSDGWSLSNVDLTLYLLLEHKFPNQNIYVYLFGYKGSTSSCPSDYGACHTDELFYLLPHNFSYPKYQPTTEDVSMSKVLSNLWINFAKTGNPTPGSKVWQPLENRKLQYLHITGPNNLSMKEGLHPNRRMFWRKNVYKNVWRRVTKVKSAYQK